MQIAEIILSAELDEIRDASIDTTVQDLSQAVDTLLYEGLTLPDCHARLKVLLEAGADPNGALNDEGWPVLPGIASSTRRRYAPKAVPDIALD